MQLLTSLMQIVVTISMLLSQGKITPAQANQFSQTVDIIKIQVDQLADESATPAPTTPVVQPTSQPIPTEEIMPKETKVTLEVIDPIPGKGRGRSMLARQNVKDEANYIVIGLIVRDQDGNELSDKSVSIESTDASQNKILNNTGNVRKIYINNVPKTVPYYEFSYDVKTSGKHTIKFTCEGVTQILEFNAGVDNRE